MIKDCLRLFQNDLIKNTDAMVLENYLPKDGTYLLVKMENGDFFQQEPVEIHYNKKSGQIEGRSNTSYTYLQHIDYYSKLVEMNKPVDPRKIIHSNNYLSFFIKKESLTGQKVTQDIIDGYYEVLKNPDKKYEKKKKSKELYNYIEEEIGKPDVILLQQIQEWIKQNLNTLIVDTERRDYLKIFFVLPEQEKTIRLYQQEGKRYLLPNIYNNNESNIENEDGILYGLPNDNMGMNSKKPFLEHKSRRIKEPYLINLEEALLQSKFFDFLMGKASLGITHVYVDMKNDKFIFCESGEFAKDFEFGLFLKIQKGKEVEIHNFDTISKYDFNLKRIFDYKKILEIPEKNLKLQKLEYGTKNNFDDMEIMIDEVFFSKWLSNNYFTDPSDLSVKDGVVKYNLLKARDGLNRWFYKGNKDGVDTLLQQISLPLVKNALANGYELKAKHQLNLRWSLMDYFAENEDMEVRMKEIRKKLREHINCVEDWEFESEDEYYYAAGQLAAFYLSKIRAGKRPQSFINPFLNAKKDEIIKKRLKELYKKVNHDLYMDSKNLRDRNLTCHVMGHTPEVKVNQEMLVCGFTDQPLVYEKKEEGK